MQDVELSIAQESQFTAEAEAIFGSALRYVHSEDASAGL